MPLHNIYAANPDQLTFTWKSFRSIYSIFITLALLFQVTCVTVWTLSKKIEFGKIVPLVMFLTNFCGVFYFFKLGIKWPNLMGRWFEVETKLPKFSEQLKKPNLSLKIKLITFVVMSFALSKYLIYYN